MYNFEAIPEFHLPKVEDFGPESYGFGPAANAQDVCGAEQSK